MPDVLIVQLLTGIVAAALGAGVTLFATARTQSLQHRNQLQRDQIQYARDVARMRNARLRDAYRDLLTAAQNIAFYVQDSQDWLHFPDEHSATKRDAGQLARDARVIIERASVELSLEVDADQEIGIANDLLRALDHYDASFPDDDKRMETAMDRIRDLTGQLRQVVRDRLSGFEMPISAAIDLPTSRRRLPWSRR